MQWRALLCVAALAVAAAVAVPADNAGPPAADGGAPTTDLCGKCKCEASSIICKCSATFQELVVAAESIGDASTLMKFEVRACPRLWLKQNAFKTAHKLQTFFVEDVQTATFEMGVFDELQSLVVHNVSSFNLRQSAFQGVKGLNNIVIKNSYIPSLPQWSLYDIKELQEMTLENVEIHVINKDAIFIDMKKDGSKTKINKCKIGNVETDGLQVGNSTEIIITNSEITVAEAKSIKISARQSMILKGNTFQRNVDVHSTLILYNNTIEFSDNTLHNVNILDITKLEEMPEHSPTYTLDRLVSTHAGNKVPCQCLDNVRNTTGLFFQNRCIRGCNDSTVYAFLQSCQKNKNLQDNERFLDICKGRVEQTTVLSTGVHNAHPTGVTLASAGQPGRTDASAQRNNTKGNGAQRNSVYFLPFFTIYLFHMIL